MMNLLFCHILSSRFGAWIEIQVLMKQTAKAFNTKAPSSLTLSTSKILRKYAVFTTDLSMRLIESNGDCKQIQQDLYNMAYRLGNFLRILLRPKNKQDCLSILVLAYHNIGIQLWQESSELFCIGKCYFSSFYSPDVCSFISAIDRGIFAGVFQRGRLSFCQRITEGNDACIAELQSESS